MRAVWLCNCGAFFHTRTVGKAILTIIALTGPSTWSLRFWHPTMKPGYDRDLSVRRTVLTSTVISRRLRWLGYASQTATVFGALKTPLSQVSLCMCYRIHRAISILVLLIHVLTACLNTLFLVLGNREFRFAVRCSQPHSGGVVEVEHSVSIDPRTKTISCKDGQSVHDGEAIGGRVPCLQAMQTCAHCLAVLYFIDQSPELKAELAEVGGSHNWVRTLYIAPFLIATIQMWNFLMFLLIFRFLLSV